MHEIFVIHQASFKEGEGQIAHVGREEIGVFNHGGRYYTYSNFCLHQGGPACEGLTIAKVEEKILADKTPKGLYFSLDKIHFVCPWHGYEYDLLTGECVSDRKLKLRRYDVIEKGEVLYVVS
jgi:nitrite reductase/ring-hydroxylating ferredoxin subunit